MPHTPGPFKAVHNAWDVSSIYDGNGNCIALCHIDGHADENTQEYYEEIKKANAQFFAACHDMMEALLLALPYVETACDDIGYKPGQVIKVVKQMKDAIDKAEGR